MLGCAQVVRRLGCSRRVQCLGSDTVALYVIGALEPDARGRADAHADRCPSCRRLIAEVARTSSCAIGGASTPEPPLPAAGVHGRYRLREVLGAGAMGIVWRAHDPELGREVAIKILRGRADLRDGGPSLLDEARAMAAVEHVNIVRVYDVGSLDGRVYVAMALVRGGTLRSWHAAAPRSWRALAEVMRQAALGLAAVHAAGLVHRDFKPENVLVDESGRAMVADFGLATAMVHDDTDELAEREGPISVRTPLLVGTPAYMAPELFAGDAPSAAADQYAWCTTFVELLTGRRPHEARRAADARLLRGTTSRRLARLFERGLAGEPTRRWPSMDDVVRELDRVLDPPRARWWALGLGALALVAGAGWTLEREPAEVPSCDLLARADRVALEPTQRREIGDAVARVRPTMQQAVQAVLERLDRWLPAWSEQAQLACEARVADPRRFAATRGCLLDRADELDALIAALVGGDDPAVDGAIEHVLTMPSPDCRAAERTSQIPDEQRAALAELRVQVWTARYAEARAATDRLLATADTVADPAFRAEVLASRGLAQLGLGELTDGIATLEQAVLAARAAGADEIEVHTGVVLVMTLADTGRTDETEDWLRHLEAAAERVPSPLTRAEVDYAAGAVAHRRRDLVTARKRYERSIAELERALGPDNVAIRDPLDALGRLEFDEGHADRALELLERALAIAEQAWGLDHPETATVAIHLAPLLAARGQPARARNLLEQALAGQRRLLGPRHRSLGTTLMQLGLLALGDGDFPRGITHLEACIEVHRDLPPTASGLVCRFNLAEARRLTEGCAGALPLLDGLADAFASVTKADEHDREITFALVAEAGCLVDTEPRRAEQALVRIGELGGAIDDRDLQAEVKLLHAKARWGLGDERGARAYAEQARALLRATPHAVDPEVMQLGGVGSIAAQVDEWIATHS